MQATRIGLIADTHGLLRPQALAALAGVDRILHAGDICRPDILEALATIAPVVAVRGNNDSGEWAAALNDAALLDIGGLTVYMLHDIKTLSVDVDAAGVDIVVAGHSHRPAIERKGSILFINPGSAGPRRFKLPVSVGLLDIAGGRASARIVTLDT